jgi:flagellar secretion chaperone FliS
VQNNASNHYKQMQIKTANQGKLIVMLYDAAIKAIKTAIDEIPNKNTYDVHTNIIKAQDIISELMLALDFEAGDIAKRLWALYTYMNKKLVEGNIKKKVEPLKEVISYLNELREAWNQIANTPTKSDSVDNNKKGLNIST